MYPRKTHNMKEAWTLEVILAIYLKSQISEYGKISWNGECTQKYMQKYWTTDSFLQTPWANNTHFIYPGVGPKKL